MLRLLVEGVSSFLWKVATFNMSVAGIAHSSISAPALPVIL